MAHRGDPDYNAQLDRAAHRLDQGGERLHRAAYLLADLHMKTEDDEY